MPTQEQLWSLANTRSQEHPNNNLTNGFWKYIAYLELRIEAIESLQQSLQPRTVAETVQVIKDATARASASPEAANQFLQDAGVGQSNSPGRTSNPDAWITDEEAWKKWGYENSALVVRVGYENAEKIFLAGRKSR